MRLKRNGYVLTRKAYILNQKPCIHRHRRHERPDQADGRHGQQWACIRRRSPGRRRRHLVRSREDVRYHGARRVRHHRTPNCGEHDLDEGLHPAEHHVTPTTFECFELQPDDEPFHGNVTDDDNEPPAQSDAIPMALEQLQQLLPAPTDVPQVLEPRPSQLLVFTNSNPVEVTHHRLSDERVRPGNLSPSSPPGVSCVPWATASYLRQKFLRRYCNFLSQWTRS